ncbi:MAG: hypothetical protein M3Z30_08580 [Gemmatimonadota bacterium]|nr:hypothetical protein [Gemmatimonadota bacterium]
MPHSDIQTYLSDHLAGASGAIALMEHVEKAFGENVAGVIRAVRLDVSDDRDTLVRIASALSVHESAPRKLSGWLGEKLTEIKLALDGGECGPLNLLESLEAIGMGIGGKLALWEGLEHAGVSDDRLRAADYQRLAERARDQRKRIERLRLETVRAVFA